MISSTQIDKMTRIEKIQVMESLWESLSKPDTEVESPSWHRDLLRETEARCAEGEEQTVDWETAKRELRKRFE